MPEMVLDGDEVVDVGADEKSRPSPPPPDPAVAPKGWRFDREQKSWVPRKRASKVPGDAADRGTGDDEDGERPDRPDSAWASGPDRREEDGRDRPGFVELSMEQSNEIEAILELTVLPLLLGAERRDPVCGKAFVDNWDQIREKSLPLIARSPSLVEWLTKAGGFRDWIAFGAAVAPVAKAVVSHHVTKTIVVEEDGAQEEDLSGYAA